MGLLISAFSCYFEQVKIFAVFLLSACLIACSQGNNPIDPNPNANDTLNGWQKYVFADSMHITDVHFTSPSTGFLIGGSKGLFRSIDSGKTWQQMYPLDTIAPGLVTMNWLNEQYGFACGSNAFGKTTDGGITWDFKFSPYGHDVSFTSPSTGFLTNPGVFYKTADTGNTWQVIKYASSFALHFLDNQRGWHTTIGPGAGLYSTTNGGSTWTQTYATGTDNIWEIQFLTANTGWMASEEGVFKTQDGGSSWQKTATQGAFDIQFINNHKGYFISGKRIYKTIDGGITWNVDAYVQSHTLLRLHFVDENHGWAIGPYGILLRWKQ